jgi:hypothetical protein
MPKKAGKYTHHPELEFLKSLWGLGTEEEEGYRTGPPGGIHSLESIPGPHTRLKIRALAVSALTRHFHFQGSHTLALGFFQSVAYAAPKDYQTFQAAASTSQAAAITFQVASSSFKQRQFHFMLRPLHFKLQPLFQTVASQFYVSYSLYILGCSHYISSCVLYILAEPSTFQAAASTFQEGASTFYSAAATFQGAVTIFQAATYTHQATVHLLHISSGVLKFQAVALFPVVA